MLTTLARRSDACPELQQEFALCFEGRLSRELADLGATAHPLASVRVSRPVSVIRSRRQLQRLLSERRFEALVFHSAWSHAIFAPVARAERLPAIVWVHGTTGGRHWSERWSRRVRPNVVVCNSNFTASRAAAVYPKVEIRVLYCPVELDSTDSGSTDRNTLRRELNTSEHAVVVVQAGRSARSATDAHRIMGEASLGHGDPEIAGYAPVGVRACCDTRAAALRVPCVAIRRRASRG